jgi:hypothetical protein
LAIVIVGWSLMGLAYDKPQWYFWTAGIIGALATFGSLGWWLVSALAERDRRKEQEAASKASQS